MAALLADAEAHGAVLALNTRLRGGWLEQAPLTIGAQPSPSPTPYKVLELSSQVLAATGANSATASASGGLAEANGPVEVSRLRTRWVVNAAGLHAMRVASSIAGLPRSSIPRLHLAKGNYFSLSIRSPFSRLIYPMPERGLAGLGTHLTLDLAGGARFGPDVEWLPGPGSGPEAPVEVDYQVDPNRAHSFYPAIRRYYPALPDDALQPAYSGVRPKLSGPGEPPADFWVQGPRNGHGVRGWVNLYGIESPGLTSSLALADYVCDVLETS
ncbi:hypothetical protein Vretifemale_8542 [Volvox reticuliferus]|nr:hypothetical protein Vretifemale_8542 [Volvox reticuliferus]